MVDRSIPAHHLALRDMLGARLERYSVIDVGAHGTGSEEVYAPALDVLDSLVIGFEADAAECDRLNSQAGDQRRYYPYAIGDGTPGTLHECRSPFTTSLLPPNPPVLQHFEGLLQQCEVVKKSAVATKRLDDIDGIEAADFLKIDIQGATLLALEGARNMLTGTLVVHAEMEFVPIYRDEPLFSECELFLRAHSFMFHHFHHIEGRRIRHGTYVVGRSPSQALWADAVFVPSLPRLDQLSAVQLARLAWTMHVVYGATDFAMTCLSRCDSLDNGDLARGYLALLAECGLSA
jgi:FkbM family methyltransferase